VGLISTFTAIFVIIQFAALIFRLH
jgi:hypothetical protein